MWHNPAMALFGRRPVTATVTTMAWSRTVDLEIQQWVAKRSSWVPSDDVRNVQKHSEQYWATVTDTQPGVPDGTGIPGPTTSSTRSELRLRVYYTYEALEWRRGRTLTASGTVPDDVRWPDDPLVTNERVRSRSETYAATFAADDKKYEASLPEPQWRTLEVGAACHLTLGLLGGVKSATRDGA
jgi:hypothetical protein